MKNNDPFWEYCNDAFLLLCLVGAVPYIKICFLIVLLFLRAFAFTRQRNRQEIETKT